MSDVAERVRCIDVVKALEQRLIAHPMADAIGADTPDLLPVDWMTAVLRRAVAYLESGITAEELRALPYPEGGG